MRLRTEKINVAPAPASEGRGYIVLTVWGDHLALQDAPAPVEQKLDASKVVIFQHRASAAMWAALTAWDNLSAGKTARSYQTYQLRSVRYRGATQTFSLNVVEGPVLCVLEGVVEAAQFAIPAQGYEKGGSTVRARPHEPVATPVPRR